ncbi:T9SS type A sorting domain-containing protein, partial [Candidatus Aerophobetes bacterium]|nr:T9SS type A sorting domain-containing protein [Candidatus Aerophobetes bacterium]
TLEWKNTDAIPKEYNLYLTDEDENVLSCMREKNNYSFTTSTERTLFKVIATTKSLSSPKNLTLTEVYSYPNPANNTANIRFKLGKEANITIKIYTISGELVKTLVENKFYSSGTFDGENNPELSWDLTNGKGSPVAKGIYIFLVEAKNSAKGLVKIFKTAVIK